MHGHCRSNLLRRELGCGRRDLGWNLRTPPRNRGECRAACLHLRREGSVVRRVRSSDRYGVSERRVECGFSVRVCVGRKPRSERQKGDR